MFPEIFRIFTTRLEEQLGLDTDHPAGRLLDGDTSPFFSMAQKRHEHLMPLQNLSLKASG